MRALRHQRCNLAVQKDGSCTNMWASLRSQTDDQNREETSVVSRRRDEARYPVGQAELSPKLINQIIIFKKNQALNCETNSLVEDN